MRRWLYIAALWTAGAYVLDVLVRPAVLAREARKRADALGKPLLNVGAGTPRSSLRTVLFGPTLWGDVNCDISTGVDGIELCDIQQLPYTDKQFGAVIASHVVEHVADPAQALHELERVADHVYAITPLWWAPHTWFHPGHLWYRDQRGDFRRLRGAEAIPVRNRITVQEATLT